MRILHEGSPDPKMSDSERKLLYKDLFWKLYSNVKDEDNEMWQPFNKEKFTIEPKFIAKVNKDQREFLLSHLDAKFQILSQK